MESGENLWIQFLRSCYIDMMAIFCARGLMHKLPSDVGVVLKIVPHANTSNSIDTHNNEIMKTQTLKYTSP